jgi:fumarate reductase subunit C
MEYTDPRSPSKVYRPKMPATWWLRSRRYFLFMMRELSSVFIAGFVLTFVYELFLLSKGPQVYSLFQQSLRQPGFLTLYSVGLVFAIYHTVTWFQAASKIQVVRLGSWTMPGWMMTAGAFGAWVAISAAVAAYFLTA